MREAWRLLAESQRLTLQIRGTARRNYLGLAQLLRAPFRASRLAGVR